MITLLKNKHCKAIHQNLMLSVQFNESKNKIQYICIYMTICKNKSAWTEHTKQTDLHIK